MPPLSNFFIHLRHWLLHHRLPTDVRVIIVFDRRLDLEQAKLGVLVDLPAWTGAVPEYSDRFTMAGIQVQLSTTETPEFRG